MISRLEQKLACMRGRGGVIVHQWFAQGSPAALTQCAVSPPHFRHSHNFSSGRFLRTLEFESDRCSGPALVLHAVMGECTGTHEEIIKDLAFWLELFYQAKPLNKCVS